MIKEFIEVAHFIAILPCVYFGSRARKVRPNLSVLKKRSRAAMIHVLYWPFDKTGKSYWKPEAHAQLLEYQKELKMGYLSFSIFLLLRYLAT